jgi:hypothetical protein
MKAAMSTIPDDQTSRLAQGFSITTPGSIIAGSSLEIKPCLTFLPWQ